MTKRILFCAVVLSMTVGMRAADDAPQWARDAAAAKVPSYPAEVPGVVLLNEKQVTVDDNGRRTLVTRMAYRALSRDGRNEAIAYEEYMTGTGKVKDIKAWLIMPSGAVKKFGKDKTADIAIREDDIYNDIRVRVIDGSGEADPGTVFAWEATSEDKSIFSQFDFDFQSRLPSLVSRFTLSLPAGWEVDGVLFNTPQQKPAVTGNTWTWEMRDLPFIKPEESAPGVSGIAPRLGVTFFPSQGGRETVHGFAKWSDVSRFQDEMTEGQDTPSEAMTEKAKSLTANAKTELERISAIGRYVQGIHYIEISTNVGRGGGYKPHAASQVFERQYGDCKDKANLMRSMLKAIGIDAKLVAIYSGDRTYTRAEWPSPFQFNHMIVAIPVGPETKATSVSDQPGFGRLLFFDPTDEVTPVGYLPEYEQDIYALVIDGAKGALVRVPQVNPETNHLARNTEIVLNADGSVKVKFVEEAKGTVAASIRRRYSRASAPEYLKFVERWLSQTVPAPVIASVKVPDSSTAAETERMIEFTSLQAGQLMQGRLLMFRPGMVSRGGRYAFGESTRKYPVVLDSESFSETVRVTLPAGFEVDEMPDPVKLERPWAVFETDYKLKDGYLIFHRSLSVQATTVPVEQYAAVREFFGKAAGAEHAAVVLAKK
jgi:hypothetical protein